jgi:hypothetical protein
MRQIKIGSSKKQDHISGPCSVLEAQILSLYFILTLILILNSVIYG